MIAARTLRKIDWMALSLIVCIPLCGLVVLYSAGFHPGGRVIDVAIFKISVASAPFAKQLLFLSLGVIVMSAAAMIPSDMVRRSAYLVYGLGIMLLLGVAFFGIVSNGSRRWLPLGVVTIQPAEFVKLGVILAMARLLSEYPPGRGGFSFVGLIRPCLIFLPPMMLVARQPDLGTALVIGWVGATIILFLGVRRRVIVCALLCGALLAMPLWRGLHDYQRQRIISLFNPDLDPRGAGYHINQSKIAVGSGELFGKGFMQGTQTQLEFLPEHTTDFIFSVLAEEWGFVGAGAVLFFYLVLFQRLIMVATRCRDLFSTLVVFGITSVLFFHTVVNIGMVMGVLPVVGIPLPLFSYGGSSVLSTMFSLGLVFGLSAQQRGGR
jgi:rod shape determining protein RodA